MFSIELINMWTGERKREIAAKVGEPAIQNLTKWNSKANQMTWNLVKKIIEWLYALFIAIWLKIIII